jgi:hypothetical protein
VYPWRESVVTTAGGPITGRRASLGGLGPPLLTVHGASSGEVFFGPRTVTPLDPGTCWPAGPNPLPPRGHLGLVRDPAGRRSKPASSKARSICRAVFGRLGGLVPSGRGDRLEIRKMNLATAAFEVQRVAPT